MPAHNKVTAQFQKAPGAHRARRRRRRPWRPRPAPAKRAARRGQEPQLATSANARSAIPASPSRLQGSGKATAPAARQCARNPLACVQARRLREAPPNARAARNDVERAGPPRPAAMRAVRRTRSPSDEVTGAGCAPEQPPAQSQRPKPETHSVRSGGFGEVACRYERGRRRLRRFRRDPPSHSTAARPLPRSSRRGGRSSGPAPSGSSAPQSASAASPWLRCNCSWRSCIAKPGGRPLHALSGAAKPSSGGSYT